MSLAWGSLALLVILLPGVLFFAGLRIPERFTREGVERSALGQLAAVLLVSLVVHGFLYVLVDPVACHFRLPCIDIGQFLTALTIDKAEPSSIRRLADDISSYRVAIFDYLLFVSFAGLGTGYLVGRGIMDGGRLAFLGQHSWVNRLTVGNQYTVAWILTNIRQDRNILMYRGFVQAAHLRKDGTFAYIVITGVRKLYLQLADEGAITVANVAELVGAKTRAAERDQISDEKKKFVDASLVVEGEDIANVMFDRYELAEDTAKVSVEDFERAVREALKRAELIVSGSATPNGDLDIRRPTPGSLPTFATERPPKLG